MGMNGGVRKKFRFKLKEDDASRDDGRGIERLGSGDSSGGALISRLPRDFRGAAKASIPGRRGWKIGHVGSKEKVYKDAIESNTLRMFYIVHARQRSIHLQEPDPPRFIDTVS